MNNKDVLSSVARAIVAWFVMVSFVALGAPGVASAQDEMERALVSGEKETAIRTIGIPTFVSSGRGRVSSSDVAAFTDLFIKLLSFKSHLQPKKIDGSLQTSAGASTLSRAARAAGVDGLLIGDLSADSVTLEVVSGQSGRILMTTIVPIPTFSMERRRAIADEVVDAFLRQFPYRGFVIQETDGEFEINLGSLHGMQPGLRMRVFEFDGTTPSLEGAREYLGEIEVKEIKGPDRSIAVPVGRTNGIGPYSKIAFADRPVGMVEETRVPSRGWVLLGGEIISIGGDVSAEKYADRAYQMDSTPFLLVGLGVGKFTGSLKFGQARNETYDLTYAELLGYWEIWERSWGLFEFTFDAGARVANFNTTTKRNVVSTIQPSTTLSPAAKVEVVYSPRGRLQVFAGAELFYPAFNSGQSFDVLPYTLGGGGFGGVRLGLRSNLDLELGARLKYFRRPVDGVSGVQERQSGFYGGLVVRF